MPCNHPIEIRPLDPTSDEAARLLRLSDAQMAGLYPPESNHSADAVELSRGNATFVGAYAGTELAGCGAVKLLDDGVRYGEIKRIFVADEHRGRGTATAIIGYLEDRARNAGAEYVRLETGVRQPDAISLYRKLGYVERPPFGAYAADPLSLFMEKPLQRRFGTSRER